MWIDEYRSAHGMELDEFARAVNAYGRKMVPPLVCTITDELIHMLERVKGCVTHPIIANAIAEYCWATPDQRDVIVAEIHRGNWEPRQRVEYAKPVEVSFNNVPSGAKPVVKINVLGEVIASYESVSDAERREPNNGDYIRKRCKRKVEREFWSTPYTYRYQEEWAAMNREEQLQDIIRDTEQENDEQED